MTMLDKPLAFSTIGVSGYGAVFANPGGRNLSGFSLS